MATYTYKSRKSQPNKSGDESQNAQVRGHASRRRSTIPPLLQGVVSDQTVPPLSQPKMPTNQAIAPAIQSTDISVAFFRSPDYGSQAHDTKEEEEEEQEVSADKPAAINISTPIQVAIPIASTALTSHDEVLEEEGAGGLPVAEPTAPMVNSPIPEIAEGETISLPDIIYPDVVGITSHDKISPMLGNTSTISVGGPTPSGFGLTSLYMGSMTNIKVSKVLGTYFVVAMHKNSIKYSARASTGPASQVDIPSSSAATLKDSNWKQAASDLTPNMSDLNGRPPRTKFWAKDLTLKHEKFHADEYSKFSTAGVTQAMTWLGAKTASSVAGVQTLVGKVPQRVVTSVKAAMTFPSKEERAYGDGASSYTARANAITTKGTAGKYPK